MVTATPMKRSVFYCAPKKPARVQPTLESLLDSLSSALNKMAGPISGGRKIQEPLLESRGQVLGTLGRVSRGGHGTKPMAFSVAGDTVTTTGVSTLAPGSVGSAAATNHSQSVEEDKYQSGTVNMTTTESAIFMKYCTKKGPDALITDAGLHLW